MADIFVAEGGPLAKAGEAIRARLELAFPPAKFEHHWMPARLDREVWEQLTRRTPMIAVGFNGFRKPETISSLNVISEWSVYVTTKNPSGQRNVLFGDKLAPGQLDLAGIGAAILHGFTIPAIGTIQVQSVANAMVEDYKEAGLSITAIELAVPVDLSLAKVLRGAGLRPETLTGEAIQWSFDGATVTDDITNTGTS